MQWREKVAPVGTFLVLEGTLALAIVPLRGVAVPAGLVQAGFVLDFVTGPFSLKGDGDVVPVAVLGPVVAILCSIMAMRAVKRDERLVWNIVMAGAMLVGFLWSTAISGGWRWYFRSFGHFKLGATIQDAIRGYSWLPSTAFMAVAITVIATNTYRLRRSRCVPS